MSSTWASGPCWAKRAWTASMTFRRLRRASGAQAALGRVLGQLCAAGHRRASSTSGTLVPQSLRVHV
jgi:hypothetical protein